MNFKAPITHGPLMVHSIHWVGYRSDSVAHVFIIWEMQRKTLFFSTINSDQWSAENEKKKNSCKNKRSIKLNFVNRINLEWKRFPLASFHYASFIERISWKWASLEWLLVCLAMLYWTVSHAHMCVRWIWKTCFFFSTNYPFNLHSFSIEQSFPVIISPFFLLSVGKKCVCVCVHIRFSFARMINLQCVRCPSIPSIWFHSLPILNHDSERDLKHVLEPFRKLPFNIQWIYTSKYIKNLRKSLILCWLFLSICNASLALSLSSFSFSSTFS